MTIKQLSDGDNDGVCIGQSPLDRLAFFGGTPVQRFSGAAQAALTRGRGAGVVATYGSTQSPSTVNAITSGERAFTVQSGTGGTMLVAATDAVVVNKPTAQAGLGLGNARVSASNTLQQSFFNASGGNITPTASEAYSIVALRGFPVLTPTLSPAQVPANSVVEQQFTVNGLIAGALAIVAKPTSQAGLDIAGVRVVGANTLGITFVNVTAAPITPTASEVYRVTQLLGLDALNNEIMFGMNMGTIGAIGAGVVATGGATTLTGLLATDILCGISKPTTSAAATNAAVPVSGLIAANTFTALFAGIGSGATPTASEVYGIKVARIAPVAPLVLYTPTISPGSVAANTTAEQTFSLPGLVAGSVVHVNKPSWTNGLGIAGVRVSAADTLAITFVNTTGSAIVPPSEAYTVGNFQLPSPGAGNVVYQTASPWADNVGNLLGALRAALVGHSFVAGS